MLVDVAGPHMLVSSVAPSVVGVADSGGAGMVPSRSAQDLDLNHSHFGSRVVLGTLRILRLNGVRAINQCQFGLHHRIIWKASFGFLQHYLSFG